MQQITLKTTINSNIERCFDLSRSIDLHQISTSKSKEIAIDGKTSGLIGLNEFVTWEATHFSVRQKLSSKITAYERPHYFVDEQIQGAFKFIHHEHLFETVDNQTLMTDKFNFESPYGFIGKMVDRCILKRYLTKLLTERNQIIKTFAETDQWKTILKH
ncbi:MAG: SRPBCC family protein [Bacteroidetes bacterium]|nr:SRPBCC family protein [Bacteroidota bacterium]